MHLMPSLVFLGALTFGSLPEFSVGYADEDLVTVSLEKDYVPVMRGGTTVMHRTSYFGTVFVGSPVPQRFTVVFDTGSGNFFLPSVSCESQTCVKHQRYDRTLSTSAVCIDHDGTAVDPDNATRESVRLEFGTGDVEGDFVYELACLRDHTEAFDLPHEDCAKVRLITATAMTKEPFELFAFDGVVGLGLQSLALLPEFSFFGQMTRLGRLKHQRFGLFVSSTDDVRSEISFGGHDETRVSEDIQWAPVSNPQLGHWQIQIRRVLVGGEPLMRCDVGECLAIVDTGTSLLGVPKHDVRRLHWKLARQAPSSEPEYDCRSSVGPDLVFDIGNFNITLTSKDYSRPKPMLVNSSRTGTSQRVCRATFLSVDMGDPFTASSWIFGEPVLRKYYTVFDWGGQQIGFAPAVQSASTGDDRMSAGEAAGVRSPSDDLLAPTEVQV